MLLITALGGTLFYGCRSSQKPAAGPVRLPVAEVAVQDVPVRKSFVGQINGYRDITIQPRADGYLRSIHFLEGSFIKKGTLLYTIETAPYAAQTAQSEASVSRAEAQLADARQTYERTKAMAAINAASRSDLDNATAQLLAAQASLRAAKAALTSARIEQGYTRITSPVDGIIGRTLAQVGDFVGLNSKYNSLNTVSQVDSVKVLFFIPEQTYAVLMQQGGQLYDLTLSLSDNSVYPERGRFDFIGRAVEQSTGSLDAQATFANPDTLLRPGQFAQVSAVTDTLRNALLIPQVAVNQTQGVYSVYVLGPDNRAEQRIVTLGQTVGPMWVVDSGLQPGEQVITDGFHKLRAGVSVEPQTNEPSAKK